MMGFLCPMAVMMAGGSPSFPAVTVGRADIGGLGYGYVRPGGPTSAIFGGLSGGTLSDTLVPGYVTDAVADVGGIEIAIMGDCTALLAGVTALMDNGTPLPVLNPAKYDSGGDYTYMAFEGSWSATGNRTVQLVGA